jgi:hypothetical protein
MFVYRDQQVKRPWRIRGLQGNFVGFFVDRVATTQR